jgi:hypothetical protein
MSDMSKRFPYINDDCEDFWNSKLPSVMEMEKLGTQDKIDVGQDTGKDFQRLILGKFCISPRCPECQSNNPKCTHSR